MYILFSHTQHTHACTHKDIFGMGRGGCIKEPYTSMTVYTCIYTFRTYTKTIDETGDICTSETLQWCNTHPVKRLLDKIHVLTVNNDLPLTVSMATPSEVPASFVATHLYSPASELCSGIIMLLCIHTHKLVSISHYILSFTKDTES